jgi:hypothetical protein
MLVNRSINLVFCLFEQMIREVDVSFRNMGRLLIDSGVSPFMFCPCV